MAIGEAVPDGTYTRDKALNRRQVREDYWGKMGERGAYILGLFISDGRVRYRKGKPNEAILYSKDILVLSLIAAELGIDVEVKKGSGQTHYISFVDPVFCQGLVDRGVCEHKKTEWKNPDVPERQMKHFIRGYMDGMANIEWEKSHGENYRITTFIYAHTYEGMAFILDWLVLNGLTRARILKRPKGRYHIRYKVQNSIKLISLIYDKAHIFRSDQKQKVERFIRKQVLASTQDEDELT